jgi:hypothetical protein
MVRHIASTRPLLVGPPSSRPVTDILLAGVAGLAIAGVFRLRGAAP